MRAPRPSSSLLVVLALVLGVALGSAGTAGAAGALTQGAVKKIAAKVVKKKAAGLRVSHAVTADRAASAATLGTLSAADLATTPTVYTITDIGTPHQQKEWLLPQLAPGTYDLRYSGALVPELAGATIACGFRDRLVPTAAYGFSASRFTDPFVAVWPSGGSVHTIAPGESTSLICISDGGTFALAPSITVSVTRLNGAVPGTVTVLPNPN